MSLYIVKQKDLVYQPDRHKVTVYLILWIKPLTKKGKTFEFYYSKVSLVTIEDLWAIALAILEIHDERWDRWGDSYYINFYNTNITILVL